MTFLIKCKIDDYSVNQGEEARFRYTISKVMPTNFREQNAYLIDQLMQYQNIHWITIFIAQEPFLKWILFWDIIWSDDETIKKLS